MAELAFQDYYPDNLSYCYGCGRLNEQSLQIKSRWEGEESVARICLTHSYPMQQALGAPPWDGTPEELSFVQQYLDGIEFDDYDHLIQLCDCLCLPDGPVLMDKRLLDVSLRYGVDEYTVPRWKAFFAVRLALEADLGCAVYDLLPGVVENTLM